MRHDTAALLALGEQCKGHLHFRDGFAFGVAATQRCSEPHVPRRAAANRKSRFVNSEKLYL